MTRRRSSKQDKQTGCLGAIFGLIGGMIKALVAIVAGLFQLFASIITWLNRQKVNLPIRGGYQVSGLLIVVFLCVLCLCGSLVYTWTDTQLRAIGILPTYTPTPSPTATSTPTVTPTATRTPVPTNTSTATRTPLPTNTPRPTQPPTRTSTPSPTLISTSTRVPATIAPQPTSPPAAACEITAWVNDENPAQRQHVYVYGKLICNDQPAVGATMHVVWNYKSTTETCDGTTDATGIAVCERSIGGASKGYKVRLDVSITYEGRTYRTNTGFTPQ